MTADFNEISSQTPHATLYKGAMLVSADVITVLDTRVELPQLSTALSSNQRQIHAVSVGMANGRRAQSSFLRGDVTVKFGGGELFRSSFSFLLVCWRQKVHDVDVSAHFC